MLSWARGSHEAAAQARQLRVGCMDFLECCGWEGGAMAISAVSDLRARGRSGLV